MRLSLGSAVGASVLVSALALQADVVKLKDGRTLQGIFLGGNARQIDFLSPGGQTLNFPLTSVSGITFSELPGAPAGGAPTAAAQPPAARPSVLIPSGTMLRVR